jgi:hypothetical protein
MVNRVAGEIHKKGGILQQTFGETVANRVRAGLLPESRRQTLPGAGKRGGDRRRRPLPLSGRSHRQRHRRQRRSRRDGPRRPVGHGPWGLVYVSPTSAGGLTQTVPTGTQKIRPVGFATRSDQIDFRPLWGTGATYTVNFDGIPQPGDILVRSATAWGAVPGTTIGAHPLVPDLRNRILRIKDGAGNDLEIHQVWIPPFDSEGFTRIRT